MPRLEQIAAPASHSEPAWQVAWNPKRNILASCSTDKTIRFYSCTLPSSSLERPDPHAVSTSQSRRRIPVSSTRPPIVYLQQTIPTEHKRTVRTIAWSPSGQTLASGSFDSTVGLWAELDAEEDDYVDGGDVAARSGVDSDGDEMMNDGSDRRELKEWECVTTLEGHESECKAVAWSSDGALLASCSRDKSVWVWEVQPDSDFECIAVMMVHTQDVKNLAWHPHEEILASASYDSHINMQWDDPDGDWCTFQKLQPRLPSSPLSLPEPPSSSSSSSTAVQESFEALKAALLPTEEERIAQEELQVPPLLEEETVWSLAFSPCGKYMASGGDLGGIRIWARAGSNPDSPWIEALHTAAHTRSVFSLSWTAVTSVSAADSTESHESLGLLASGAGDGKIIILEIFQAIPPPSSSAEVGTSESTIRKTGLPPIPQIKAVPIAGMRDAHGVADVNSVSWLERQDGRGSGVLASCADDGSVKVWRVVSDE